MTDREELGQILLQLVELHKRHAGQMDKVVRILGHLDQRLDVVEAQR